jgi:Type VIII secretion system (T8SS), CsgF protein
MMSMIHVKKRGLCTGLFFFMVVQGSCVWADKLIYYPVNPNFGGNSANGAVLLNEATAQNSFQNPVDIAAATFSARLNNSVEQAVINKISGQVDTSPLFDANGNIQTNKKVCFAGTNACTTASYSPNGGLQFNFSTP